MRHDPVNLSSVVCFCVKMVVLQESGSPIQAPAAAILDFDYRQTTTCLKMLPKRYINVHQWLGPICTKDIKAQIVSVPFFYDFCTADVMVHINYHKENFF